MCVCVRVCVSVRVCVRERVQPPDKDALYPWLDVASHLNKRAGPSVYHPSVCPTIGLSVSTFLKNGQMKKTTLRYH